MSAHLLSDLRVRPHRMGVEEARGWFAGQVFDVPQAHDGHRVAEVAAVILTMNSKKPRPVLEHRNGAKWNRTNPCQEGTNPVPNLPQPAEDSVPRIDTDTLLAEFEAALDDAHTALYALLAQPTDVAIPQVRLGLEITDRCLQAVA